MGVDRRESSAVPIPGALMRRHSRTAAGRAWLDRLPQIIGRRLAAWNLSVDLLPGIQPWHGSGGLVVPVTRRGNAAVLKVAFPYDEALVEPLALRLWDGDGAVEIFDDDRADCAMLLQRLDGDRWLQSAPMDEATTVWGSLMRRLMLPPDQRPEWKHFESIAQRAEQWCDELPQEWERLGQPFQKWLLEAALEVCQTRGAVGRHDGADVLVNTDFHYMNILARLDAPSEYLAIDPQPMVGEAEFAVAPLLWNRIPDLPRTRPERGLEERLHLLCDAAGLDAGLAAQWTVVREVDNALWYAGNGHDGDFRRSLWVASTIAGRRHPGLPPAHELKRLGPPLAANRP